MTKIEGSIEGTINSKNAPVIKVDKLENFTKLKNDTKTDERSPVVHCKSHTKDVYGFVYGGVVYTHEKSAK